MNKRVSRKVKFRGQRFTPRLQSIGRLALWAVLALLLLRGADQVIAGPEPVPGEASFNRGAQLDPASASVAIRFARTYLAEPDLAVRLGHRRKYPAGAQVVAQAEVARHRKLWRAGASSPSPAKSSATRAPSTWPSRSSARGAGEVAALGAPSLVAAPGEAGATPSAPASRRPRCRARSGRLVADSSLPTSASTCRLISPTAWRREQRLAARGGFALAAAPTVAEL